MNKVTMKYHFSASVVQDGEVFVSHCKALDVSSQGDGIQEALDSLQEAVAMFLESCLERNVLHVILEEAGFKRRESFMVDHLELDEPSQSKYSIDVPMELLANAENGTDCMAHAC